MNLVIGQDDNHSTWPLISEVHAIPDALRLLLKCCMGDQSGFTTWCSIFTVTRVPYRFGYFLQHYTQTYFVHPIFITHSNLCFHYLPTVSLSCTWPNRSLWLRGPVRHCLVLCWVLQQGEEGKTVPLERNSRTNLTATDQIAWIL